MMSQTHIGYTYWQQPERQKMPEVHYLSADSVITGEHIIASENKRVPLPATVSPPVFYQDEKKGVSIEADHYSKAINTNGITWKVLPDHGRTGSAITPFPVTASEQKPGGNAPHLQYVH